MPIANMVAEAGTTVGDTADAITTMPSMAALIELVKQGVAGVFSMATSAFNFLFNNPLCAFSLCVGFGYTALSLVRKGLRVAKRS